MVGMDNLSELWNSNDARYDEGVLRAREEIERCWPKEASLRVADVKGYFHDFIVMAEAQPDEDRLFRAMRMLAAPVLRHDPERLVRMAAEDMEAVYRDALRTVPVR